jgi:predicted transcriptional regulator
MPHLLESEYGLTADELLNAINRRFRAKVTLEGAVAEVHLGKQIQRLKEAGIISRFESHDKDGYPDYTIWLPGDSHGQLVECKGSSPIIVGEVGAFRSETI